MTLADSLTYLHRYQQWRTGEDDRNMEEADLSPKTTTEAINAILAYVPQLQKNHASVASKLRKCQVKRNAYNLQLRKDLKSQPPADS